MPKFCLKSVRKRFPFGPRVPRHIGAFRDKGQGTRTRERRFFRPPTSSPFGRWPSLPSKGRKQRQRRRYAREGQIHSKPEAMLGKGRREEAWVGQCTQGLWEKCPLPDQRPRINQAIKESNVGKALVSRGPPSFPSIPPWVRFYHRSRGNTSKTREEGYPRRV